MLKPILLLVLLPFSVFCIDFSKALEDRLISAHASSTGDFSGPCIKLQIRNNSPTTLNINIPSGTRFQSSDYTEQDVILSRSKQLNLEPAQNLNTILYGFCCQASNKSPSKGSVFKKMSTTNNTLFKLCQFLDKHHFKQDIEQFAVWCISDNKELYSIIYSQDDSIKVLLNFLSKHTGKEIPDYQVKYWNNEFHVTSNRPTGLYLTFDYSVLEPGLSSVILYDRYGTAVKSAIIDKWHNPGNYSKKLEWQGNIQRGEYTLTHFHNGNVQKQKKITI